MNIFVLENRLKQTFSWNKYWQDIQQINLYKTLTSFINMFLTNKTRLKIKDIIKRISSDDKVTLEERIYLEKWAKHNSTIWTWLKKANSLRRYGKQNSDGINGLIQNLGLDGLENENHFDPRNDDIADWFSGSPDWVRRS